MTFGLSKPRTSGFTSDHRTLGTPETDDKPPSPAPPPPLLAPILSRTCMYRAVYVRCLFIAKRNTTEYTESSPLRSFTGTVCSLCRFPTMPSKPRLRPFENIVMCECLSFCVSGYFAVGDQKHDSRLPLQFLAIRTRTAVHEHKYASTYEWTSYARRRLLW